MNRVRVLPVRSFGGHIQGWAVTVRNPWGTWREIHFGRNRISALSIGHNYARKHGRQTL